MAKKKKKIQIFIIFLIFILYFFIAARPIPRETILAQRWINSLPDTLVIDDGYGTPALDRYLPFTLGNYFGFVDYSGQFALNRISDGEIYLSQNMWTEFSSQPSSIIINNVTENSKITIENPRGYPVLLDNRIFILGSEQNSLSEIGNDGNILWTYEFGAPLTSIDAAAGLVVTGSLDGAIEVFNSGGQRIFYFEPGGSSYNIILGCSISRDGSRIAVISGIEQQRFLLLERFGNTGGEYRIVYHEFLETGFRRPVHVLFIDEDRRVVFERAGGISFYNIRSRHTMFIPLDGEIAAVDGLGSQGFFFIVTSGSSGEKALTGISFPPERLFRRSAPANTVFMKAPFKSENVFLGRITGSEAGSMLVVGGGTTLISFNMEEK